MNRLKLCFITLLCVLPLFGSMAQSVKIEGSVRDSQTDELLPGVNVMVKGSSVGAMTNIDGAFLPFKRVLCLNFLLSDMRNRSMR